MKNGIACAFVAHIIGRFRTNEMGMELAKKEGCRCSHKKEVGCCRREAKSQTGFLGRGGKMEQESLGVYLLNPR